MSNKQFSERLNLALDEIGLPVRSEQRIEAFAKLIHIPRFQAESILQGYSPLEPELLNRIAEELEVSTDWLLGKTNHPDK